MSSGNIIKDHGIRSEDHRGVTIVWKYRSSERSFRKAVNIASGWETKRRYFVANPATLTLALHDRSYDGKLHSVEIEKYLSDNNFLVPRHGFIFHELMC